MVNILDEFTTPDQSNVYFHGTVISISLNGLVNVRTDSGIKLTIKDTNESYSINDTLILGSNNGDTNNAFIIRKINRTVPSSVNYTIAFDIG